MGNLKKIGAPTKGKEKKVMFRISIKQEKIDYLGEEKIREICDEAINDAFIELKQ